jgi:phage shock protein A
MLWTPLQKLQADLQESLSQQGDLEYRLQLAESLVKEWQARAERAVSNAKYDQIAREAQEEGDSDGARAGHRQGRSGAAAGASVSAAVV